MSSNQWGSDNEFDYIQFCVYCLLVAKKLQNKIYEMRKKCDMTQEKLAVTAGVTRQTIIAIEKGNYVPSVALALIFAHIFSLPIEDLFWYD